MSVFVHRRKREGLSQWEAGASAAADVACQVTQISSPRRRRATKVAATRSSRRQARQMYRRGSPLRCSELHQAVRAARPRINTSIRA